MDGDLAVLASSAATAIVGLIATDAWGQAKEKVTALWRHFQPAQADAIEFDLDRARRERAGASEAVALAISGEWESRLLRLLAVDTAVAAELNLVIGKTLMTAALDGTIQLWDVADPAHPADIAILGRESAIAGLAAAAISPDGHLLPRPNGGSTSRASRTLRPARRAYAAPEPGQIASANKHGATALVSPSRAATAQPPDASQSRQKHWLSPRSKDNS
jgi:hypothetical protein